MQSTNRRAVNMDQKLCKNHVALTALQTIKSPFTLMVFLLTFSPWIVMACPVCGFGQDGSRTAFLGTALLMTFVPLIFVGTVIAVIYRHSKFHSKKDQALNNSMPKKSKYTPTRSPTSYS